jgi:hypothetical protein
VASPNTRDRILLTSLALFNAEGLAAFYTLTLISPYVSSDSRAYLDYLRAKYLG